MTRLCACLVSAVLMEFIRCYVDLRVCTHLADCFIRLIIVLYILSTDISILGYF